MVEKKYLNSVDGFIFNSRTTREVVNGLLEDPKPNVIAYPPTDRFGAQISEDEISERAKNGELRILFLGNVMYRKGLHTLLEAVKGLGSRVKVDIVGSLTSEPTYTKLMQDLIAKNDLSSFTPALAPGASVFLHGSLDQEPLIEKFRQAHVLVVPSSYEGFGIVYLEGMGFGLPAIGTSAGAAGEIIEHGKTGFLIEPDDSLSLAKHLKSLTEDRALLTRLSFNARARFLRQPAWTDTAKSIRRFLASLI